MHPTNMNISTNANNSNEAAVITNIQISILRSVFQNSLNTMPLFPPHELLHV